MKGAILSCFVIVVAIFLVSQAFAQRRWNFDEDANEMDFVETQKRSDLERRKRLCGISSRRQGRCRLGVRINTFSSHGRGKIFSGKD